LTAHLEQTILSEKMIEEDLSRFEESASKSTYRLGVGFEECSQVFSQLLLPQRGSNNQIQQSSLPIQPKSHPSTQREKQGKKSPSQERKLLCACFVAVLVTWMSFASGIIE
jgi:hypothetical protein